MRIIPLLALLACSGTEEAPPAPAADAAAEATDAEATKAKRPEPKVIPAPEDVAAPPADAQRTASGLAYKVLTPGTGTERPGPFSRVTVNHVGWTTVGTMLKESSLPRGRPANLGISEPNVVPGLKEGLQLMVQGEKTRFWIPAELATGATGQPDGGLVYEVELVSFASPPPAPPDVAAAPAGAERTPGGVEYVVLKPGAGEEHPSQHARVIVNYTGWTTDGKVVDSTVARGRPQTLTLSGDGAMPGWVEAITHMLRGEKRRVWIPERLVQNDAMPKGTLVYEIELLTFDNPVPPPADVAAPPADAKKTASGIAYKVLQRGEGGAKPSTESIVTVHYTGWTTDGKMFDSSSKRNKAAEFPLGGVIPGWTEGLQLMTKGEKTRFWIPEDLAYKGRPGKPAGMLVFDVELLSFKEPPPPIPAPPDVAEPPADAKKTESGLAYHVLQKGTGTDHPGPTGRVKVHYTGWTTDGKMFDSSVLRGEPASFGLNRVIAGWTEGLQLMVVGEKTRFWIPEALAYKGAPGKPAGMLVFDVELLEVLPDMPRATLPGGPPGGGARPEPPKPQ